MKQMWENRRADCGVDHAGGIRRRRDKQRQTGTTTLHTTNEEGSGTNVRKPASLLHV
ncbi:MAG: hypothetical protein R3E01_09695 [Pirellulaceae bacterium]